MGKYLFRGSYTSEGTKALLKEGGTARRAAVEKLAESVGGKLEAMYFAFGESDAYVIADLPDSAAAAAFSLVALASGALSVKTTVLLTPEEMDAAARKKAHYRPPGN